MISLHTRVGLAAGKATDRRSVLAAARAKHPYLFGAAAAPKNLDLPERVWINRADDESEIPEATETPAT
ncbi:hypothetical protein R4P64_30060 [Rhodococcus sp. IEGM 1366]|uniref:hypothetical protein n=1 Tax=Rhodococcus sp. IEGM 1366 TaxID=3082223 RepID=UPI002954B899|nr:hypothetical protein [Rhodococcus sp. IEGM 1366]MDV8070775.1 hypothetical protein [Rhodococcus sp. IEGM 1366]